MIFPTCQVMAVRFYVRCAAPRSSSPSSFLLPLSSPDLICQLLIAVGLAGLHCQLLIAVVVARPDLPALDRSGPCRTSTGESLSAVSLAGLQPDLNGHRQSHIDMTDRMPKDMPDRMSEDLQNRIPDRMSKDMPDIAR